MDLSLYLPSSLYQFPEPTLANLEILLWTFLLSWLVSRFEPLQWFIKLFPNNKFRFLIETLTSCIKCVSLYVCFILSFNIFLPAMSSFIAMLYDKTIGSWETKIKFK
jgi:uncharacterized membrane protein YjgN (DUF898 family)